MKKYFYLASFFLLLINSLLASCSLAGERDNWNRELYDYLVKINYEYAYYAHLYDDGSYFPKTRQQEILSHIENYFLKPHADKIFAGSINPLESTIDVALAKLLLRYGGQAIEGRSGATVIVAISWQGQRYKNIDPNLTHAEIIDMIEKNPNDKISDYWFRRIPSNNAINLIKLYLSLGADIYTKDFLDRTPLIISLYTYEDAPLHPYKGSRKVVPHIRPDEKHRAADILRIDSDAGTNYFTYRTPLTYWIEEFIEAGYPASMLDTHKLHYPRYMKRVSVEDVKKILDNPKAHAIKTNINCNYDKDEDEDETALICPLTPSINMRDAMGRTPLHIAGEQGNEDVFNYLKNNGADTSIKDYRGNLAMLN